MLRKQNTFVKKIIIFLIILVIVTMTAGFFLVYLPYTRIKARGQELADELKLMKGDIKKNDIDLLSRRLDSISKKYQALEKESQQIYWAEFIPYVADYKNGLEAGSYLIHAGREAVSAIEPYADLIGFKKGKGGSFYEKTSEERLQTAVLTLDKMLKRIDIVSKDIAEAEKRIEKIDPKRYPERIGRYEIKAQLIALKDQFKGMASLFVDAKPLLKKLPDIFGAEKERIYLVLFQNTAERRATGGFLTFYAVFKINKGKITIDRASDIYDLDANIAVHPPAPDKIIQYHKDVNRFYIRDSNLSPDFGESVRLFESLYSKAGNRVKYDGIIALDSKVLVDMLEIFGDTQASGVNFSAKKDERCDCPQVIYTLFDIVDRPTHYIKVNRKGIIGELMYQLLYKAIGFSPSKYWGRLVETMFRNLDEKHILLHFTDPNIQKAVESLNWAGKLRDYSGDYLHINQVNFAGAKSNLFINEEIISQTEYTNGEIKRTVRIVYRNPYRHSDCNLERGGLCLNAILRNWIRVYVPAGSKLISFRGSETKVVSYDELGKTVFEGFNRVSPQGRAEVVVEYKLPVNIKRDGYQLLIQKQPGNERQKLRVLIEGKEKFGGPFNNDKEIK